MQHHSEASTDENQTATQEQTTTFGTGNLGLQVTQNNGNITANFNHQPDQIEVSQNRECLQTLCETNPQRDKDRIERHKGGLLEDAYNWVFENAEFKRWRFEEKEQLLWIKGDPGKGKTMLLCGIINELINSTVASENTIIYFFCQATDEKLNNAAGVLRGLIYMLVDQHPYLISHLRWEYDKDKRIFEDRRNSWETLSRIFIKILEDPTLQKIQIHVMVDALDECTTDLSLLLEFIVHIQSSNTNGKWIVTSRNETSIEEILDTHEITSKKGNLSLELNEHSVSRAVEYFINFRVQTLSKRKRYSPGTRDAVVQHLLSNAHGTFLWVALVCDELLNPRLSNLQVPKRLKQFPAGLDRLYGRMLEQIEDDSGSEICKYILSITATVYRPITLEELSCYIEFSEEDDISYLSQLIGLCGSFLTLRGSTISLLHQSAKDFIHQKAVDKIFPYGPAKVHHDIFSKSLKAINTTLRRDIYGLIRPGYMIEKVEQPNSDPLAAVGYSCIHWVDHLKACSQFRAEFPDDFAEGGTVDEFFRKNYLNWLEAISLLRSVSKGITSILKLEDMIEPETHNADLIDRVKDASRFVLYHQVPIRRWPLQVYASALIFSPVNSRTRIQYEDQQPSWILQKPDMEYQWSPCLQTLEEHRESVYSVSFSHDSKLLASASHDSTVKIWDTESGACLTTFEHSDIVHGMVISRDFKLLITVSTSIHGKLRSTFNLWDMEKNNCIISIEESDGKLSSVAFHEPDCIVCGLDNGNIKFWDIRTRKCSRVIKGNGAIVSAVTISQTLGLLASTSHGEAIKIWDLLSGKCVQTLEDKPTEAVAFSPDSLLLASGLANNSIKLWDTGNWDCIHTLAQDATPEIDYWTTTRMGYWSTGIRSLVFSHDSRLLATNSSSRSEAINIWDIRTELLLQTFKGHRLSVHSVAFSHNSQLLASASEDRSIRVWDATSRQRPNDFDTHNSWSEPCFSHDCRLLATIESYEPYDIKIWDVHNGNCLRIINGWSGGRVYELMFSRDLRHLASSSEDKKARVWDVSNGKCLHIIELYHLESLKSFFLDNTDLETTIHLSSHFAEGPSFIEHGATSNSEGLGMSEDGKCVTWDNECLLWLPLEYRPNTLSNVWEDGAVVGSRLCIACASGRMIFFNFDSYAVSKLLETSRAKELAYPDALPRTHSLELRPPAWFSR